MHVEGDGRLCMTAARDFAWALYGDDQALVERARGRVVQDGGTGSVEQHGAHARPTVAGSGPGGGFATLPGDWRETCEADDLLAGAAAGFGQGVQPGEHREASDAVDAAPGLRHGGKWGRLATWAYSLRWRLIVHGLAYVSRRSTTPLK